MAMLRTLTVVDIEAGLDHPDYEGWGYLGERGRHGRMADIAIVDQAVLGAANAHGWSADQLADFAISKVGRWLADETFGSGYHGAELEREAAAAVARYIVR